MKILLVEDDAFMSAALAKMLAADHYTIAVAADGQTGLEQAIAVEYDLILLDLQIPKLDGFNLCRQLRSQGYRKPILVLTAKDSNTDIVKGLDAGADDYVIKPYEPDTLLARIRALLHRSTEGFKTNTKTTAIQADSPKKHTPSAEDIATANRVLAKLSDSFKKQVAEKLVVLEQAHTALLAGNLEDGLKQAAKHEAHKLAGSMTTFGYPEGSKLGRAIEYLLMNDRTLTPAEVSRFSQLLAALQQELTKSPVTPLISPVPRVPL